MTIVVVEMEDAKALNFMADSRVSGNVRTENAGKIFPLNVQVVIQDGDRFRVNHTSKLAVAFAGSTLSAQNAIGIVGSCLENLLRRPGEQTPTVADIAEFFAKVAKSAISDISSRTGLADRRAFFFQALLGGYCQRSRRFELYQIEPELADDVFLVTAHPLDLQMGRFYPIGSGTAAFVRLCDEMAVAGFERGAYGALELFLALGDNPDVGGWINFAQLRRSDYEILPTVRTDLLDEGAPPVINLLGTSTTDLGCVGECSIGYRLRGPKPPIDWLPGAIHWARARQ